VRRLLGIPVVLTAAGTAAVTLYVLFTLPPGTVVFEDSLPDNVIVGGYHVHTNRSDGTGTVDEVAEAAARAGLGYLVLTDHGDGTRQPIPPAYRHGVLVIDAVELNTSAGHLVALGLEQATPYPLAGHPRDVIEDIHRLGGVAVIAHPDSPSPELRWRGQNVTADGIEWLNVDSEWRDDAPARLVATALRSLIRGPESIASLFSRPTPALGRLDATARQRATFTVAALDAHANIGWRDTEEPRQRSIIRRPTYEAMFRTVSQSVVLDAALSGNAAKDAADVLEALTHGRSFSLIRAFARPASLSFVADRGMEQAGMGDRLAGAGIPTTFRASIPQAPGARLSLLANGQPIATGQGSLEHDTNAESGVYRIEATLPQSTAPWIVSNAIVITPGEPAGVPAPAPPTEVGQLVPIPATTDTWRIEREPTSSGTVSIDGTALRFSFSLAAGQPRGQYAALAAPVTTASGIDHVRFEGRASTPMRVSLQVRLPGGRDGHRWRRSVYLDETPRTIVASLQEFDPVEPYTSQRPVVAPVQTLLLVVDTMNTLPGSAGTIWISDVVLGVRQP
jgi:hypothetical protein